MVAWCNELIAVLADKRGHHFAWVESVSASLSSYGLMRAAHTRSVVDSGMSVAIPCIRELLLIGVAMSGPPLHQAGHGDESLRQRFLEEAPARWNDYCRLATQLEGSVRFRQVDREKNGEVLHEAQYLFAIDATRAVRQGKEGSRRATAQGTNSTYEFSLRDKDDGQWLLGDISWHPSGRSISQDVPGLAGTGPLGKRDALGLSVGDACRGMLIWATWFPNVVASHDFQIVAVGVLADGDASLVKVEFTYEPAATDPNNPVRSGEVILDPNRYWLIRRAKVDGTWVGNPQRGTITVVNEYVDGRLSFPVITRQVMHVSARETDNSVVEHDWIWELDLRKATHNDDKRFTLSAFGISEPVKPGRSRARIVFAVLNILAIIGLIVVIALSRR